MQDSSIASALAMRMLQSGTQTAIWFFLRIKHFHCNLMTSCGVRHLLNIGSGNTLSNVRLSHCLNQCWLIVCTKYISMKFYSKLESLIQHLQMSSGKFPSSSSGLIALISTITFTYDKQHPGECSTLWKWYDMMFVWNALVMVTWLNLHDLLEFYYDHIYRTKPN